MAKCPSCGGMLRFDIPSQQMKCDSCESMFDPYQINGGAAEETTEYNVTIFKCPNCGGEIISTDETAASFCSYCGASAVLESRISSEKKPELIIPFKQTKAQCTTAFERFIRKAIFAPKSYRDAGRAQSFRGIYMPYWLYDMTQRGDVNIPTSSAHRSGDYIITDHYQCRGKLDSYYNGVSYDASSSFADDISTDIAPFNVKDITTFNPSFLSGYYADIADVDSSVYQDTAVELAKESTYNYLIRQSPMKGNHFDEPKSTTKSKIITNVQVKRSAMFPVWFMSYRNHNRVAYATVNGQTGKVSADIPMSVSKFFICAALIAIGVFCLLQAFLTITPDVLIVIAAILGMIGVSIYCSELKKIVAKENYDDDKGMLTRMEAKRKARMEAQRGAAFDGQEGAYELTKNDIRRMKAEEKKRKKEKAKTTSFIASFVLIVVLMFIFGPLALSIIAGLASVAKVSIVGGIIGLILFVVTIIKSIQAKKDIDEMKSKNGLPASYFTAASMLIIAIISFWDPPSDFIYYGAAVLAMVGIIINLIDLMRCHNLLAMRPLPQFDMYKGGDDRA
ncbi:MAG: hypothetical protein J5517_02190 [Eubacterium sp.]|nr:hypothetical protein [Eubacterium sp.]